MINVCDGEKWWKKWKRIVKIAVHYCPASQPHERRPTGTPTARAKIGLMPTPTTNLNGIFHYDSFEASPYYVIWYDFSNFLVTLFKIVEGNVFDGQSSSIMVRKHLSGQYGNIANFYPLLPLQSRHSHSLVIGLKSVQLFLLEVFVPNMTFGYSRENISKEDVKNISRGSLNLVAEGPQNPDPTILFVNLTCRPPENDLNCPSLTCPD